MVSSVIIRDNNGTNIFTFNPMPYDVNYQIDNTVGKNPLDMPSFYRPMVFWLRSQTRRLTMKVLILSSSFLGGQTIVNQLDQIKQIMNGANSTYYQIQIPFSEAFIGSPISSYTSSDASFENAMFVSGQNYMQVYVHPDLMSIDKISVNAVWLTLTFTEVSSVVQIA